MVNLTINEEDAPSPAIAHKLPQLACINANLEKLNETDPLPPEFIRVADMRLFRVN